MMEGEVMAWALLTWAEPVYPVWRHGYVLLPTQSLVYIISCARPCGQGVSGQIALSKHCGHNKGAPETAEESPFEANRGPDRGQLLFRQHAYSKESTWQVFR